MFSNETILKTIREMIKQYETIENEDEFRKKSIDLVLNTYKVDYYQAEVLFDLAYSDEAIYLTNTDSEIEFDISFHIGYRHFECWLHSDEHIWRNYKISYNFWWDVPIIEMLKDLDRIANAMEQLNDTAIEDEKCRWYLPLI